MAILSTNQRLIKVDVGYSAGNGIDITSGVISVTGDNAPYSAGQNIYFDGDDNHVINGKDWGDDINDASANAFNTASAWVAQNYANSADLTYLSGVVDNKLDTSAWSSVSADMATEQYVIANGNMVFGRTTAWVNDQHYSTVSQLESVSSDLNTNKLDSSSYHELTAGENIDIQNYIISSKDWTNDIQNASANAYNESTGYVNNWIEETYSTDKNALSAAIDYVSGNAGDQEVNSLVHSNSGEWNNVSAKLDSTAFSTVSGDFLTAIPDEYATKDFVSNSITGKLDISSFSSVSGDFLTNEDLNGYATETFVQDTSANITALIPTDYYPVTNPSGFITGVDLSNYYTKTDTSSKEEISAAIAAIPLGDEEVNQAVHTNSATWNTVSDKLDTTAFSDVSSTFLTAHQSLDGYATESFVENVSGDITALIPTDYATTEQINDLSGAIDYVSANAGDQEVNNLVHTNSATWDFVTNKLDTTAFSEVSGSFLTAVDIPESATWNETSNVVQSNSAQWGQGGTTYTSPSGTILINGDTLEGTNSAISIVGYEGFVSSYGLSPVGPNDTATYTWDKALPTNTITLDTWATNYTLYWSANTDLTGEIVLPEAGRTIQSISIPNATAFAAWCDNYFNINGATVSAADTLETVVGELAWASALPSYEYDITNKISAINGSAIAAGDEFPASADEAIQCVQSNSSNWQNVSNKLDTTAFSDVSGTFLTAQQNADWTATAGVTQILNKPEEVSYELLNISAGPGIDIQDTQDSLVISSTIDVSQFLTNEDITGKLDTSIYAADSATFLTAIPTSTMDVNLLNLTNGGKISGYNGSAIYAQGGGGGEGGGDMFTAYLEYNDQNQISGYAGTAFAGQGGAGNPEVESYVQTNSATIDDVNTNVTTNSGAWGGIALPVSAGKGVGIGVINDTLVVSSTLTGYVWTSASLFTTATPTKNTSYTLSDNCSNYDKLEVDFYDINNWRTQMDCPIPPNLAASGTRGGYFNVVTENTSTTAHVWFKCFNWTAAQNNFTCYCSEMAAQGGSTTQSVNANQPDNPPKVIQIIGWKRVEV